MSAAPGHVDDTEALRAFLDASPSAWHAADAAVQILEAGGFAEHHFAGTSPPRAGFVRRGGSVVAWRGTAPDPVTARLRIAAAHTDSPGLRIKPHPESTVAGLVRLGVEVYGGPLLNSWLDRDLGLAGRVLVADGPGLQIRSFIDRDPILRIPQLAIHLDRGVNDKGLKLDRQEHLQPVFGPAGNGTSFAEHVAAAVDTDPGRVRAWDLVPFDLTPARRCGAGGAFLASARLDDLLSCHAALTALVAAEPDEHTIGVVVLVDHEEVGSTSSTGAAGRFVPDLLERVAAGLGFDRTGWLDLLARSHAVSLDMAHATHPDHPGRHDPSHTVLLDAGPVVKHNAQQRYATGLESLAPFLAACERADVGVQHFVSHSEMPCGSTIGPALAAGLGIPVVDVGVAQLAMHSTREMCGAGDHARLVRALTGYLSQT